MHVGKRDGRAYMSAVASHTPEPIDPELDALLRSRRPMPDPEWVAATERRLLPPRRRPSWRRAPALGVGVPLTVVLAGLVLALSLAGGGPVGASQSVDAKDDCR